MLFSAITYVFLVLAAPSLLVLVPMLCIVLLMVSLSVLMAVVASAAFGVWVWFCCLRAVLGLLGRGVRLA